MDPGYNPHFEMYTTNSEKQAARALQVFEQVRYFFLEGGKVKPAADTTVRIIAFSSERDYKPYRPSAGAFAYYLQSRERDYIVMQDIQPDHHATAVHEYTHLIMQHRNLQLPIWLNEGLAELYSSLEPRGKQAMVGRPEASRAYTLSTAKWIDWDVLFAVDYKSPYYSESEKMSIFYAQSWVLTHMLELSPGYRDRFFDFVSAIAKGASTPDAFQTVYGKSIAEVAKDVSSYVRQTAFQAALFDVTLSQSALSPQVTELSPFQVDLALADLLGSKAGSTDEARRRLTLLSEQNRDRFEPEESLGYLAWQNNDIPEAITHFAKAVDRGSKDTRMLYELALMKQSIQHEPEEVAALLRMLLAIDPGHIDGRLLLAEIEGRRGRYSEAIACLEPVKKLEPVHAYRFFAVHAFSYANLHRYAEARSSAERALQYAKTPDERLQVSDLIERLEQANRPPAILSHPEAQRELPAPAGGESSGTPVERNSVQLARSQGLPRVLGTTVAFDCSSGSYRLHLRVGAREMVFAMRDLRDILVRNVKDLQWSCGPLPSRDVTVVYEPSGGGGLDGTVSELIF